MRNAYIRNLLEGLFSEVFNQRSAQRLPIVMPEVNDVVSPVGLSHIECRLVTTLSIVEAVENRELTLSSGNRKELKYQKTKSSKISRLFKKSVTFMRLLDLPSVRTGPNHSHFKIFISCRTWCSDTISNLRNSINSRMSAPHRSQQDTDNKSRVTHSA